MEDITDRLAWARERDLPMQVQDGILQAYIKGSWRYVARLSREDT